jgi:hypothetical protein
LLLSIIVLKHTRALLITASNRSMADLSLDDLLSGLQAVQEKKAKVRRHWTLHSRHRRSVGGGSPPSAWGWLAGWLQAKLSERNVVELVNKLKQLGLLGDELLHTTNGKEYITKEQVAREVKQAVAEAGGRIPLVRSPAAGQCAVCDV